MDTCTHGNTGECARCAKNAYHRQWQQNNRERVNEYNREWMAQSRGPRKTTPDAPDCGTSTCDKCHRCKNRKWMADNRRLKRERAQYGKS
jgi:hypothetical protein